MKILIHTKCRLLSSVHNSHSLGQFVVRKEGGCPEWVVSDLVQLIQLLAGNTRF